MLLWKVGGGGWVHLDFSTSSSPFVSELRLCKLNSIYIERIQKCASKIILGKYYTSHENALDKLNMKTLNERRQTLCLNFAKKGLFQNLLISIIWRLEMAWNMLSILLNQKNISTLQFPIYKNY